MIKSDQHTDPLFRQLNDLESQPSRRVWKGVEAHLTKKRGKHRLLPLFKWGAAAAVLLAVGLLWMFDGQKDLPVDEQISYSQNKENANDVQSLEKQSHDHQKETKEGTTEAINKPTLFADEKSSTTPPENKKEDQTGPADTTTNHAESPTQKQPDKKKENLPEKMQPRPLQFTHEKNNKLLARTHLQNKRGPVQKSESIPSSAPNKSLIVGGEYSPTYAFRDVSGSSTASSRESGIMTGGGGFSLTLKMNDRWQIETGVNYARLGQEVKTKTRSDRSFGFIPSKAETDIPDITGVQLDNTMGTIRSTDSSPQKTPGDKIFRAPSNEVVKIRDADTNDKNQPRLEQALEYVKIPFTLRYRVFKNQNIGISLSGGLSANWLVGNEAYLNMSSERQYIGNTEGLSNRSISSHAGVGLTMPLLRQLHLRMEPRVDYFISDINNNPVRYRPYSLGVYTGIFYEF